MSQMAPWGWDRGLVSPSQFLRSLPLGPSKPAAGCPATLPPSGTSPGQRGHRGWPLPTWHLSRAPGHRCRWEGGSPQLRLHGTDRELRIQPGQSALCSGESGPLGFFTKRISSICHATASLTQHLARQVCPSQDGLLVEAEALRANQAPLPAHLRWSLGLFPQLGFCEQCCNGVQMSLQDPDFNSWINIQTWDSSIVQLLLLLSHFCRVRLCATP